MEQDATATMPVMDSGKQNNGNGWKIATVVILIIAVCGVAFGIYTLIDNMNQKQEVANLQQQINNMSQAQEDSVINSDVAIPEAEKLVSKYTSLGNTVGGCPSQLNLQLTEEKTIEKAANYIVKQNSLTPIYEDMRQWYTIDYDLLNKTYKELFGESLEDIKKQDYEFGDYRYHSPMSLIYDESNNIFKAAYPDGIGSCVGDTFHLANIVWAQKTNNTIDIVVDYTEIDNSATFFIGKQDESNDNIKIESYLFKFIDDGGYVLKEITKIR